MGRRGPPKKPTQLKLIQGVPGGAHKLNTEEPLPEKVKDSKPPYWLNDKAKQIWNEEAKKLEALGLLTEIDLIEFARFCSLLEKWIKLEEDIEKNGYTQTSINKQGFVYTTTRPELHIYKSIGKDIQRLAQNFGMSPSSRSSITGLKSLEKKDSVKSKLYG